METKSEHWCLKRKFQILMIQVSILRNETKRSIISIQSQNSQLIRNGEKGKGRGGREEEEEEGEAKEKKEKAAKGEEEEKIRRDN